MSDLGYSGQFFGDKEYNIKVRTGDDILNVTGDAVCGELLLATGGDNPGLYIATQTSTDDSFEIYRVSEISPSNKIL